MNIKKNKLRIQSKNYIKVPYLVREKLTVFIVSFVTKPLR